MTLISTPEFKRRAKIGLAILTLINLFNYLDRYVVSSLVESLKNSELHVNDAQAGFLMTGFIVVYMCTSPFFGVLGDRVSRSKLLAFGIGLWSLATVLAGFAHHYAVLFLARAAVGIGEAAYATIAPALISDYFPPRMRGRVFAIFYAAIPIGSALGYIVGGMVDQHLGWRAAFFVAGLPGILLAFLALGILDPPRGIQETAPTDTKPAPTGFHSYLTLFRDKPYMLIVLGLAAYTFAVGGLAFWMPTFLERIRGLSKNQATVSFGGIVIVTGFVGTFLGGFLGDYFLKFNKHSYLYLSGITMLLATPLTFLALSSTTPAIYFSSILTALLLVFISTGPINSAIANVVSAEMRACAFAASNFIIHILGDVPSPPLIGAISDSASLAKGVLIVPVFIFLSGVIWIYSALHAQRTS